MKLRLCHVMNIISIYSELTDLFTVENLFYVFAQIKAAFIAFWKLVDAGDVQGTILFCLLIWLLINVLLIRIAWTFYGQNICHKSLRSGKL